MKKTLITFMVMFCSITTITTLLAFKTVDTEKIKGWFLAGNNPKGYAIGIENSAERKGHGLNADSLVEIPCLDPRTTMMSICDTEEENAEYDALFL